MIDAHERVLDDAPALLSGMHRRSGGPAARPLFIGGNFAWLHSPDRSMPERCTAVVICSGLGWDGLHAHHSLRVLAEELARRGFHAVRLHYPGTGNSADPAMAGGEAPDLWQAWHSAVSETCACVRTATGARHVILVGLRAGALLACDVAGSRPYVAGLVLIAPVLRGKSYMRQLDMEARLETGVEPAADGGLEFHELHFPAEVMRRVERLDAREMRPPPGCKVAIFPQTPSTLVTSCANTWSAGGADVHLGDFAGLEPLLQETIHSDPPPVELGPVLDWIDAAAPQGLLAAASQQPWLPSLSLPSAEERPVQFGPDARLFGVLCRPVSPVATAPLVLILNTGRDPHYGIARLGTEFARALAAIGVASFRFDFAGLGDSRLPPDEPDHLSPAFERDRTGDVAAAIEAMERLGYHRFATQGLCAGAYHSFWAAATDRRIELLLLLNMPLFAWQGGDTVTVALWKNASLTRVLAKALSPAAWTRVVTGGGDARAALMTLARRLVGRVKQAVGLRQAAPLPQHAVAAREIAARGARTLLLYGPGDPGLDALAAAFGPGGRGLAALGGYTVREAPGIDHVLSGRHMREAAIREMVGFVQAQVTQEA